MDNLLSMVETLMIWLQDLLVDHNGGIYNSLEKVSGVRISDPLMNNDFSFPPSFLLKVNRKRHITNHGSSTGPLAIADD
ncbi:hypothetical protein SCA6_012673 [Theobroma cacao]